MRMHLYSTLSLERTFACRHTLEPLMINIFVAGTSAVFEPSTARSATTGSAGFLEHTAFAARHRVRGHWGGGQCGD